MAAPQTRPLGNSGITVSMPGMGLWAIGGHWGPTDDQAALDAIALAMDHGVTFFDTADVYGGGRSEQLLGRAMAGKRDRVAIATKIGWTNYNGEANRSAYDSVAKVIAGVEENLRRLQTDHVDVLFNHIFYPEPNTDIMVEGFKALKQQGKVRAIGISTADFDFIQRLHRDGACDVLQIDYSILNRAAEKDILPYC